MKEYYTTYEQWLGRERAKGELYSMLHTFWEHIGEEHEKYLELSSSINRFITSVEDNGLHE